MASPARPLPPPTRSVPRPERLAHLALAALAWGAALGATLLWAPYVERAAFMFFWAAVLFTAWRAGFAAAVVAALAAVAAVNYFVFEPRYQFGFVRPGDLPVVILFVAVSAFVSGLTARARRAERLATARAASLEAANLQLREQQDALEHQATELEMQAAELEAQTEEANEQRQRAEAATEEAERRRTQAEAASRAKGDFLAVMSHELRTPINAALGYGDLLGAGIYGPVTPEQVEALERIRRSQRRLLALVNDVLEFARLESGRLAYRREEVPLRPMLDGLEALVAPQLGAAGLAYDYAPPATPVLLLVERARVEQILLNLLANAIKFTPSGGRVTLSADVGDDDVAIHVADTGRGIAPEQLEAIFQPFVQGDQTLTRAAEGAGLGLAISRELARAFGGDVTVRSAPGAGTTFTLTLPLADAVRTRTLPTASSREQTAR